MPFTACWICAPVMLALVARASISRPYQVAAAEPFCALNCTGLAAVPLTVKVPLMITSTRAASRPLAWPSVLANCTIVPAWMVRNAPEGTVMSPWTTYGFPAGVHVWLMMLPPTMFVACAARAPRRSTPSAARIESRRTSGGALRGVMGTWKKLKKEWIAPRRRGRP